MYPNMVAKHVSKHVSKHVAKRESKDGAKEPPKDAAPKTKMIRNATKKYLVHCLWGALWCAIWLPEIRIAWGGLTGTSHRALARLKGNHTLASLFPQGLPASHTSFIFEPIRACWEHQLTNHCNAIEKSTGSHA